MQTSHPKGLYFLFMVEMWERFSYYGMRALLMLYMLKYLAFSTSHAGSVYGTYTGLVYLTPLIGGYIADRYLGPKKCIFIGALLMMFGHFIMVFTDLVFFYTALGLLIIGNGFFKPNISTLVGKLYEKNDPRRDGGFTIFYMGINLGAFLSPLICGTLGEKVGFHYGFGAAGIGMLIGLLIYKWGESRYLSNIGNNTLLEEERIEYAQAISAQQVQYFQEEINNDSVSAKVAVLEKTFDNPPPTKSNTALTKEEKQKMSVIFILMFFSIFFWASFEQAGSSLTIFAHESTNRIIPFLNWEFPVSYFQSINPLLIIVLAPLFSRIWLDISRSNKNISTPVKFSIGLFLVAAGFIVMTLAASQAQEAGKVSFLWLVGVYFFHTIGELCISPVGLSMVTKLAPVKFASLLMGTWLSASFFANFIAGLFAGTYTSSGSVNFFMIPIFVTLIPAIIILLISKPIRKWMNGVQ